MAVPTIDSKKRIIYTTIAMLIVVFIYIGRVGWIQIVKGKKYSEKAIAQWTSGVPLNPNRGTIIDTKGVKLAVTLDRYTVWIRPKAMDGKKIDKISKNLSKTLDLDEKEIKKKIDKGDIVSIKQWIDKKEADKVNELGIEGVDVVEDNKRYYPKEYLASSIIGHINAEGEGVNGIELTFNDQLRGKEGKLIKVLDGKGNSSTEGESKKYNPVNGYEVALTLDSKIQEITEQAVMEAKNKHNAKEVAAIVMNPKNGEILAMSSSDRYDLNNPNKLLSGIEGEVTEEEKLELLLKSWSNYNISNVYEPGSTFKTLVTAGGLDEGEITPNSTFYCGGLVTQVESDTPIKCWIYPGSHGHQTLSEGLANSCNVMMVDIGMKLKGEGLYKYIQDFGFGTKTGIELPSEEIGIIPATPNDIKNATLANISFGQGISVTPLQLVTAVSSIANGGELLKPHIVKQIKDENGKIVEKSKKDVVRRTISKETSKEMLSIMGDAVEGNYSDRFNVEGYSVGAKTGTSQKIVGGKYSDVKHIGSFTGIAPLNDPEIVVLTLVDEPGNGAYFGMDTAGPIGQAIIQKTLEYMRIKKDKNPEESSDVEVPNLIGIKVKDAKEILLGEGLDFIIDTEYVEDEKIVKGQAPEPKKVVKKGSIIKLKTE